MDRELRTLGRASDDADDRAALLRARLRQGSLSEAHLRLARDLGDPAATAALGERSFQARSLVGLLERGGHAALQRAALSACWLCLPVWESLQPDFVEPTAAIYAALEARAAGGDEGPLRAALGQLYEALWEPHRDPLTGEVGFLDEMAAEQQREFDYAWDVNLFDQDAGEGSELTDAEEARGEDWLNWLTNDPPGEDFPLLVPTGLSGREVVWALEGAAELCAKPEEAPELLAWVLKNAAQVTSKEAVEDLVARKVIAWALADPAPDLG